MWCILNATYLVERLDNQHLVPVDVAGFLPLWWWGESLREKGRNGNHVNSETVEEERISKRKVVKVLQINKAHTNFSRQKVQS